MQTQSQVELGLVGKVVLVTGGARGVGAGITRVLGSLGARPVICGRNADNLADDLREVDFGSCDVRDADAVEAMMDEIIGRAGRIDGVVNNCRRIPVRTGRRRRSSFPARSSISICSLRWPWPRRSMQTQSMVVRS